MKRLRTQPCRVLAVSMESEDRNGMKINRVVREMGEEAGRKKKAGEPRRKKEKCLRIWRENLPSWGMRGKSKAGVGWEVIECNNCEIF